MIDALLFLGLLALLSYLVYKFLKVTFKIFYWSVAIGIAYVLLRFFIL